MEDTQDESTLPVTLKFATDYTKLSDDVGEWVFRKAVQTVHSYPIDNELGVTARRVMNALCVHAQRLFAQMSDLQKSQIKDPGIRATPIFKIKVSTIKMMIEQSSNDNERIYKAIDNLAEWKFLFNIMADQTGESKVVERVKASFLSQVGIGERDGLINGEISYEMPNSVLLMVLDPFPYAQIDMHCVNSLKRAYAIALYENTVRYLGSESKKTAILPVDEWISLIAGPGKYVDQFNDFKRYCLEPAIKELASLDTVPYTLELIPKKGPHNKTIALQFELIPRRQASFGFDAPPPVWQKSLVETLKTHYKMSIPMICELANMGSEEEINEAMLRVHRAEEKMRANGEAISNRSKYLMKTLANLQKGQSRKESESMVSEESEAHQKLLQAQEKAAKIKDAFAKHQSKAIEVKLAELPEYELALVREAYMEANKSFTTDRLISTGKGWEGAFLKNQLIQWIRSTPSMASRFLTRPDEIDIDVWRELQ